MNAEKSGSEILHIRRKNPEKLSQVLAFGMRSAIIGLLCSGCVPLLKKPPEISRNTSERSPLTEERTIFIEAHHTTTVPDELVFEFQQGAYQPSLHQRATLSASFPRASDHVYQPLSRVEYFYPPEEPTTEPEPVAAMLLEKIVPDIQPIQQPVDSHEVPFENHSEDVRTDTLPAKISPPYWKESITRDQDILYFYLLLLTFLAASIVVVGHERLQARKVAQIMADLSLQHGRL